MNHHKIDYIEFPAKNITKIKEFYSSVFGWKFTDYGPDYTSFDDGRLTGGFYVPSDNPSKAPLVVIYSEKLEETRETVLKHGGTIVREIFEFPGGRRFHFTDPDDNELAVWTDK